MIKQKLIPIAFLLSIFVPFEIFACSAFFFNGDRKIFAKNFDWSSGNGYVIKNNRGQMKYAYGLRKATPAQWTSKYGSITFNQIGKENPYGGMNEKGLVVEQLWLASSYYQENNNAVIAELEWIQFQLDNYNSVAEIIANINNLTIKPVKATVHYFVADKTGKSAVIDFVKGNTVISTPETHFQVLTNSTYAASVNYFGKFGEKADKNSRSSEDRFCQVTNNLSKTNVTAPAQAFEILSASAEDKVNYKTYWTIVYDLEKMEVHYKSYDNKTIKIIRLTDFSYNENDRISGAKINADVFTFAKYTPELNAALLRSSLKMMNVELDNALASEHQMSPGQSRTDTVYQNRYLDLKLNFNIKNMKGLLFYTFTQGEENFKRRKGVYSVLIPVSENRIQTIIYALPKGEYAIASFHDLDSDYKMDKGLFGIPKGYAFSNNARGLFGLPPKYEKAKINLQNDVELAIDMK